MKIVKLNRGSEVELFPANQSRAYFSVRVLTFGATVTFKTDKNIAIPGNDTTYNIESAIPWTGAIAAVCNVDAEIEVSETAQS